MTLWNKCTKYTICAILSGFYKCKKYTIYLKCSFLKNRKQLKTAANMADRFRVQGTHKITSRYVTRSPPIRQRKEYGANGLFRKKKKNQKIKNSDSQKKIRKRKIKK